MFEKTNEMLDSFLQMGIPGMDLLVYKNGQPILRSLKGTADREGTIPLTGKERYAMYSMSKPITCTCAMQLWEKGLFSLEDPLSEYLPEFRNMQVRGADGLENAKNPILIRHLFEMTAGLNYDFTAPWVEKVKNATAGACHTREAIRFLAEEPLDFEPGHSWKYSLCHDVLAVLVEVISGTLFRDYVREHVFAPLGMDRSTFYLPTEEYCLLAPHYRYLRETGEYVTENLPPRHKLGPEYDAGGGGLISTVEDYIRFAEALRLGDVVLGKDTIRLMATDRMNEQTRQARKGKKYGYGLGLRCPRLDEVTPYTDFGWSGAAGAYLAVDIPRGISMVYVQHVAAPPNGPLRSVLYQTLAEEVDHM